MDKKESVKVRRNDILFTPELWAKIDEFRKIDNRSVNNFVETAVKEKILKMGGSFEEKNTFVSANQLFGLK